MDSGSFASLSRSPLHLSRQTLRCHESLSHPTPSYHWLTPRLADDPAPPPPLPHCFLLHLSSYEWRTCLISPRSHGAPLSSVHISFELLSLPNHFPFPVLFRLCCFSSSQHLSPPPPPCLKTSRLRNSFWGKKMHLWLALGRTFKMSVLISTLTLPLYCFIISPSAKKKKRKKKKKKHQIVHKQKGSIIPLSPLQPCISLGHSILCLVDLFLFLSSFSFLAFHTYSAPFLFNLSLFLISIIYFPSLSLSLSLSLHLLLHPGSIPEPLQKQRVMTKMMRVEDGERGDKYRE